ncbi:DUF6089 family protein [Maribacter sp. 2210JD10-5]|uniref:type IX secretion system protein PorG n=1 Tax=Maribacter sp. 2210JD10-5 TaxID=3386272 RepID=UPI0039BCFCE5
MRKIAFVILFFTLLGLRAQTYEVGVFAGGANVIGDVGRTNFILPSNLAFGGLFKWNKSKRYAWRGSLTYGKFTANDNKASTNSRRQRGYVADNSVLEASAGLEFNFVEYNLHKLGPAFTPYIYTGATYFRYDYNFFNDVGEFVYANQKDGGFAIPMIVGVKYRINQFLIFGAEIGARYTFTDNLDASNPVKLNVSEFFNPSFGNVFSDDWYVFSGLTLTYTFGRKPCMDCFE